MSTQTQKKHLRIPDDLMQDFIQRKITSQELADKTGYHPVYLRRSIKRCERDSTDRAKEKQERKDLLEAREAFRKSIAGKSQAEIMKLAHVSATTAARIKKKYHV